MNVSTNDSLLYSETAKKIADNLRAELQWYADHSEEIKNTIASITSYASECSKIFLNPQSQQAMIESTRIAIENAKWVTANYQEIIIMCREAAPRLAKELKSLSRNVVQPKIDSISAADDKPLETVFFDSSKLNEIIADTPLEEAVKPEETVSHRHSISLAEAISLINLLIVLLMAIFNIQQTRKDSQSSQEFKNSFDKYIQIEEERNRLIETQIGIDDFNRLESKQDCIVELCTDLSEQVNLLLERAQNEPLENMDEETDCEDDSARS